MKEGDAGGWEMGDVRNLLAEQIISAIMLF